MARDLFHPFEDNLLQYARDDFQESHGSCDSYPLGIHIYFTKFSNHFHAHIMMDLGSCPVEGNQRLMLRIKSICILGLLTRICE
jgi:hypothetical protein